MTPERRQKKSETIDVRAPYSLKKALMARARLENRSASEIVRALIEDYLKRPAQRPLTQSLESAMTTVRSHPRPAFAAILGAAGLSALLAGALPAGAAPDFRAQFERFDSDGDGVVTREDVDQALARELARTPRAPRIQADGEVPPEVQRILDAHRTPNRQQAIVNLCVQGESPDGAPAGQTRFMDMFDDDGDGRITLDEYEARLGYATRCAFAALDVNGDGGLDRAEYPLGYGAADSADADGEAPLTEAEFGEAFGTGFSFGLALGQSASLSSP